LALTLKTSAAISSPAYQQNPATRRFKKSLIYGHIFNFDYGRSMVSSQRIAGGTVNPDAIQSLIDRTFSDA
jgi:hypothetical protein